MKCECDIEKLTTAGTLFLEGLGIDLTEHGRNSFAPDIRRTLPKSSTLLSMTNVMR